MLLKRHGRSLICRNTDKIDSLNNKSLKQTYQGSISYACVIFIGCRTFPPDIFIAVGLLILQIIL